MPLERLAGLHQVLPQSILLSSVNNMPILDNSAMNAGLASLRERLPSTWLLERSPGRDEGFDALVTVTSKGGDQLTLAIEFKPRLEPREVARLAQRLRDSQPDLVPLVISPYLSPRTRQLLTEAELGYLDLAGNSWLTTERPAIFIHTTGSEQNPDPELRPARSLQGPVAGRIVRTLCDQSGPLGVRELAALVQADPGYVSRLVQLLEKEALVERQPRGPVHTVHWEALLRRWAEEFNPLEPERVQAFLDPRGLPAFTEKLKHAPFRYAVTGSLAVQDVAPIASPRLATVYVDEPVQAAEALGLIPAEAGINVWLVQPFDQVVYAQCRLPLRHAALSQVVVDLLHSPGRGPQEAEELIKWMRGHENVWRA